MQILTCHPLVMGLMLFSVGHTSTTMQAPKWRDGIAPSA
jgi:hypothetical protein